MEKIPAIAVIDVGKTNKKILVFDPDYRVLYEDSVFIPEITDEDGFPCEDIGALNDFLRAAPGRVRSDERISLKAMNFSGYGASLVHIGRGGSVKGPLYNYLKPFKDEWRNHFEAKYGSIRRVSEETASPDLGSLNSGMQLYRLASFNEAFRREVSYSLHLPQYLSWFFSGRAVTEITSVGCHTMLWDFNKGKYHSWVESEQLNDFFAPFHFAERPVTSDVEEHGLIFGTGLHDSSASLIPYLKMGGEKFVVLSTGTWTICLNPFNIDPLTSAELEKDCLSYLTPYRDPVKASRFFSGPAHDLILKKISDRFNSIPDMSKQRFKPEWHHASLQHLDISECQSPEEAYQKSMWLFILELKKSMDLSIGQTGIQRICVDGGFSRNEIFLQSLARAYPELDLYAAAVPQASAIGAAMILEGIWNPEPPALGLVELRYVPGNYPRQ